MLARRVPVLSAPAGSASPIGFDPLMGVVGVTDSWSRRLDAHAPPLARDTRSNEKQPDRD